MSKRADMNKIGYGNMCGSRLNVRLKTLSLSLCCVFLIGYFPTADASKNHVVSARHVNTIQTKQAKSIEAGVSLGKLTPKEAKRLRKEQYEITRIEREMREDGILTGEELKVLFERLQSSQKHINKLLRNEISTYRRITNSDSHESPSEY